MADIILVSTGLPADLGKQQDRTPNVPHISTIIRSLCLMYGHYDEDLERDYDRMKLGLALEFAIIHMLRQMEPNRYLIPHELYKDGLYGHPDLLDYQVEIVNEIKLTERSSYSGQEDNECKIGQVADITHAIHSDKFWRDWVQLKAYCKMVGYNTGQLWIGHSRGDYRDHKVVFNIWQSTWTNAELDSNWSMLRTQARRMELDNPNVWLGAA